MSEMRQGTKRKKDNINFFLMDRKFSKSEMRQGTKEGFQILWSRHSIGGLSCLGRGLRSLSALVLILSFSVSRQYLEKRWTDSIQIWHVVVTGIQGVSYFKVTLNSYV